MNYWIALMLRGTLKVTHVRHLVQHRIIVPTKFDHHLILLKVIRTPLRVPLQKVPIGEVHMQEAIPGIKATARINGTGTTTTIEHLTNVCVTRFLMIERFWFACLGFNPERLLNREGLMKDMLDTNEMLRAVLMLTTNESTKVGLVLIMIPTSTQVLHGLTKPPYSQSTQSWNGSWNTDANWNQSWSSHWWSASSY